MRSEKVILTASPRGGKKRTTVRSTLRVLNATFDDGGFYMCASHQSSKDVSTMDWNEVFVNIHRNIIKHFKLIPIIQSMFNDNQTVFF